MPQQSSYSRWRMLFLGIACLVLVSPVNVSLFSTQNGSRQGFSAEISGVGVSHPDRSEDLNQDGIQECVRLVQETLVIYACADLSQAPLWQSPADWKVAGWTFSDLNQDGLPEITLFTWRKFAPWPVDKTMPSSGRINNFHDQQGNSCHVILIGWKKGDFRELWAGSALADPVLSLLAVDVDGDGAQELVTIEGKYQQNKLFRSGALAIWKWNGFGFSLFQRMEGSFRRVAVLESSQKWILASQ